MLRTWEISPSRGTPEALPAIKSCLERCPSMRIHFFSRSRGFPGPSPSIIYGRMPIREKCFPQLSLLPDTHPGHLRPPLLCIPCIYAPIYSQSVLLLKCAVPKMQIKIRLDSPDNPLSIPLSLHDSRNNRARNSCFMRNVAGGTDHATGICQ